jgi:hypothetical protein
MAIATWTKADFALIAKRIHDDTSMDQDAKRLEAKEWAKGLADADDLFDRIERDRFMAAALGESK